MSISGLYIGTSSLQAQQIALEVTGQNIANVNTEGYSRQRASLVQSLPISRSYGTVGSGVRVDGIERIRDAFVDLEIRKQSSQVGGNSVKADMLDRTEKIFNDPSTSGLDTMIGNFFDALYDVVNSPDSVGMKHTTILEAQSMADQIRFVNDELDQLRIDINKAIKEDVKEINTLLREIASYNEDIVKTEAGVTSDANDMRDKRDLALKKLSELVNISTTEMDTGEVNVSIGGHSVVFGATCNELDTRVKEGDELPIDEVILEGTGTPLTISDGELYGYIQARDTDIVKYIDKLDTLARGLIDNVNQIHTQGRPINGYSSYESVNAVANPSAALNASSNLDITPVDTTINITVIDKSTSSCTETTVSIDVDVSSDSLNDVVSDINTALSNAGYSEIVASVTLDNTLSISSSDDDYTFTIQSATDNKDNFLAAIGMNTFFSGTDASNIDVNSYLVNHPEAFANARSGASGDNTNALQLAQLRDRQVMDSDSKTIEEYYQDMIVELGSDTREAGTVLEASNSFLTQLELKRESISGVSLDEEAANLIIFQRAYEASARYINVIDSLLNTLVNGLI